MEGELEGHLDEEERASGNRKNGKTSKKLKTADGTIDLETPRDRAASFEPQIVKKRVTTLAESLENKIIGLYSHGMNLPDISAHIKEYPFGERQLFRIDVVYNFAEKESNGKR